MIAFLQMLYEVGAAWVESHPRAAVLLAALAAMVIEGIFGVTVEVVDTAAGPIPGV